MKGPHDESLEGGRGRNLGDCEDLEAKTSSGPRESRETSEAMARVMERPEDLVRPGCSIGSAYL